MLFRTLCWKRKRLVRTERTKKQNRLGEKVEKFFPFPWWFLFPMPPLAQPRPALLLLCTRSGLTYKKKSTVLWMPILSANPPLPLVSGRCTCVHVCWSESMLPCFEASFNSAKFILFYSEFLFTAPWHCYWPLPLSLSHSSVHGAYVRICVCTRVFHIWPNGSVCGLLPRFCHNPGPSHPFPFPLERVKVPDDLLL